MPGPPLILKLYTELPPPPAAPCPPGIPRFLSDACEDGIVWACAPKAGTGAMESGGLLRCATAAGEGGLFMVVVGDSGAKYNGSIWASREGTRLVCIIQGWGKQLVNARLETT